jgi:hypothetical protein
MAGRADEHIAPTGFLYIYGAIRVVGKTPLVLRK